MLPFLSSRLPFELHLWLAARLMPQVVKHRELGDILARATPPLGDRPYAGIPAAKIIGSIKAVVAKPWRMRGRRCLREGLLAFRFLKMAGFHPVLRFGIIGNTVRTGRPKAHCWVLLNGETVLNPPQARMVHLFDYDGLNMTVPSVMQQWSGAENE